MLWIKELLNVIVRSWWCDPNPLHRYTWQPLWNSLSNASVTWVILLHCSFFKVSKLEKSSKFRPFRPWQMTFGTIQSNPALGNWLVPSLGRFMPKQSKSYWLVCWENGVKCNKRPLGLTAPLSNNTWSMIQSSMNIKWPWFDLSMPPKVKCHEVNWKIIYDSLCVYEILYMMLHLGDTTFWSHVTLIRPW